MRAMLFSKSLHLLPLPQWTGMLLVKVREDEPMHLRMLFLHCILNDWVDWVAVSIFHLLRESPPRLTASWVLQVDTRNRWRQQKKAPVGSEAGSFFFTQSWHQCGSAGNHWKRTIVSFSLSLWQLGATLSITVTSDWPLEIRQGCSRVHVQLSYGDGNKIHLEEWGYILAEPYMSDLS